MPAKKLPVKKKKKVPAAMSTVQKDALQSADDRKLTSLSQKIKDGKVDHGDAADPSPGRGVLDPEKFDDFNHEFRATGSETQRMAKVICEHLDEYYSRNGKYQWTTGWFLETDPRSQGTEGWQALTPAMIGEAWSTQLQRELGLTVYNGALCWNGRGTTERHIVCVKTKQLQAKQLESMAESAEGAIRQPEKVAGKDVGTLEVTEEIKRLPLVPAGGE